MDMVLNSLKGYLQSTVLKRFVAALLLANLTEDYFPGQITKRKSRTPSGPLPLSYCSSSTIISSLYKSYFYSQIGDGLEVLQENQPISAHPIPPTVITQKTSM